jgi:hypothetical protein
VASFLIEDHIHKKGVAVAVPTPATPNSQSLEDSEARRETSKESTLGDCVSDRPVIGL